MTTPSIEPRRDPSPHPSDRDLRLDADHGVVRPGHPRVGDRRGPVRLHARVVRLDVRVRPDHGCHVSVERAGDRDLLARRLRVEVDDHDLGVAVRFLDERVEHLEGADRRVDEERAEHVHHRDRGPVRRRRHREPAAGRAAVEVRRPDDPLGVNEIAGELRSSPDVVPERDHVGAGGQQPLRELRRDARAVRGVLSVDDAELDPELGPQARQPVLDRPPTGRAEDIADEQDPHRDPT